jgi:hypothetical protein
MSEKDDVHTPLKCIAHSSGYLVVDLYITGKRRTRYVHQIVLEAFGFSRELGQQVRHLNGDRHDNRLENLRWGSAKENGEDRVRHGTALRGEAMATSKLTEANVHQIRQLAQAEVPQSEIARRFSIGQPHVHKIITRKIWRHVA